MSPLHSRLSVFVPMQTGLVSVLLFLLWQVTSDTTRHLRERFIKRSLERLKLQEQEHSWKKKGKTKKKKKRGREKKKRVERWGCRECPSAVSSDLLHYFIPSGIHPTSKKGVSTVKTQALRKQESEKLNQCFIVFNTVNTVTVGKKSNLTQCKASDGVYVTIKWLD